MKRCGFSLLLILIMCLLLLPSAATPVWAAEVANGSCGDRVTWSLDDSGILTISGTGTMTDYTFDGENQRPTAPWYPYNALITSVNIGEGITDIGEFAFMNLSNVSSVSFPTTLVNIGGHAFQHLNLLTNITLPEGLESIGTYAFAGSQFTEFYIPDSLKSLACASIKATNVYIDTLEHWLEIEFVPDQYGSIESSTPLLYEGSALYIDGVLATDVVIPNGTTEITPYRFHNLVSMTSISIPRSVTIIGEGAFWGCDGLTEISIPDSVINLGGRVLMECENLTTAELPSGLTEIPESTFSGCKKLVNFTLPPKVTSIGRCAFEWCSSLTHFNETNSLEKVTFIGGYAFVRCHNLQFGDLKLSPNLYYMGDDYNGYAFAWCDGITSVTIPGSLNNLPWTSFENCINLERVTIEKGVTAIGAGAFSNCSKLASVIIPQSVTTIKNNAFHPCASLTDIYIVNEACIIAEPYRQEMTGTLQYPVGIPGTTIIHGKTGSTAETYASTHGFMFEILPQTCEFGYHDYSTAITTPATCTEQGYTTHTCACGDSYVDTYVDVQGHDMGAWVSCENGQERRDCKNCDHYEIREVAKTELSAPVAKITNVASSGKPQVSWNKVEGAVKYQVYRSTSKNGTYKRLSTTKNTSLTNTSATAGKTYYYKVRAVAEDGTTSAFSNVVKRTCDLAQPTVTIKNTASTGKVKLSWKAVDGAENYIVYRATSKDGKYSKLKTTTATSYTDSSAKVGKTYYYKVVAVHKTSSANSAYSKVVSAVRDLAQPKASVSLTSKKQAKVKWGAVEGAKEYVVYRATSKDGTYTKLKTTAQTSYTDKSVKSGKTYYYKVVAAHKTSTANSARSTEVKIKVK